MLNLDLVVLFERETQGRVLGLEAIGLEASDPQPTRELVQ